MIWWQVKALVEEDDSNVFYLHKYEAWKSLSFSSNVNRSLARQLHLNSGVTKDQMLEARCSSNSEVQMKSDEYQSTRFRFSLLFCILDFFVCVTLWQPFEVLRNHVYSVPVQVSKQSNKASQRNLRGLSHLTPLSKQTLLVMNMQLYYFILS